MSTPTTTWWRRNRLWLALLVPLLLAALAASSFRLVTLHLPWEWSRPIVASGSSGTLTQEYRDLDGEQRSREVRVDVVELEEVESYNGAKAMVGGTLWNVVLELEADPDQFLFGCEVELTDKDGTRYDFRSSLEPVEEDGFFLPPMLIHCVPEHAPGPTIEPLTGEVVASPTQRPRLWRQEVQIVMPDGVEPAGVRIGWHKPVYLVLDTP
ncbi:MAG: hypothetical protein R2722_08555 [Tessaracoccus sp.]